MKRKQYENTPIGLFALVSLSEIRQYARGYDGTLSDWEHVTIVKNDGKYSYYESGDSMNDLRRDLRQSGIKCVIWECFEGETIIYGDPDRIMYETPDLCGEDFSLTSLIQMRPFDVLFDKGFFFSEYSNM